MPTTYKVLGQTSTAGNNGNGAQTLVAATNTNLYTVPAATQTVISTINICNQGVNSDTVRVAIRPSGTAIAATHYILFEEPIAGYSSITITAGLTMGATDIITVYSTAGTCSFSAYGSEIS